MRMELLSLLRLLPPRLRVHSWVAFMLFVSVVVTPLAFLVACFAPPVLHWIALGCFVLGSSIFLVGIFIRLVGKDHCSKLQRFLALLASWALNPAMVAAASYQDHPDLCMCCGMPLGLVLVVFSGFQQTLDVDLVLADDAGFALIIWFVSRFLCILAPMWLISIQVVLYLPVKIVDPKDHDAMQVLGFGSCLLFSLKCYGACLGFSEGWFLKSLLLIILAVGDLIGLVYLTDTKKDSGKTVALCLNFFVAGVLLMVISLRRMALVMRWSHVLGVWRDRSSRSLSLAHSGESSDSEDDSGPGSLPSTFFETLLALIDIPASGTSAAPRTWLSGPRRAIVLSESGTELTSPDCESALVVGGDLAAEDVEPVASPAASGCGDMALMALSPCVQSLSLLHNDSLGNVGHSASASSSAAVPAACTAGSESTSAASSLVVVSLPPTPELETLRILPELRTCSVCLEDIQTGELVRPLAKCDHKFHAACLERWAGTMHDATRCPTCRRPALAKKGDVGAVSITDLVAQRQQEAAEERLQQQERNMAVWRSRAQTRMAQRLRRFGQQSTDDTFIEFSIVLVKEDSKIGVDVQSSQWVYISSIQAGGVMERWNRANRREKVVKGDRIQAVEGVSGGPEQIIKAIQTWPDGTDLSLTIKRLVRFRVCLHRSPGQRLGIEVESGMHPYIKIIRLTQGLFRDEWNARVACDRDVRPKDRIVEVNLVNSSSQDMLRVLQGDEPELFITIVRPIRNREFTELPVADNLA
eukprot:TRINITY_DN38152_c0_g2_i1.p1 TRINITY_DN38152_c0_g2~~TRINITY_DN38152_c0_g2_i1.p1  ORF type:complete len:755 (+),score=166.95 TRINITY_DN38152_c0_g2_i1:54-2318(+)